VGEGEEEQNMILESLLREMEGCREVQYVKRPRKIV
jgi:hypothetical protein